jgi:aminoglycoside phosphotransferase (APT) family kinase protein
VIHVDDERRATLTAFVIDQSFAARYRNPQTHERALDELGQTLRALHALPLPADADVAKLAAAPWTLLPSSWAAVMTAEIGLPSFVRSGVEQLLAERAPEPGRNPVLSHNDVHPKNLVHDGERLYLMDWDAAGPNDPFYDLATIAVFLSMDGATCRKLLGAYEDAPWEGPLPARFVYNRRLIAAICGVGFLLHGFRSGYREGSVAADGQTLDETPTLGAFYQRMRAGELSLGTGEGCWAFGLALVRESVTPIA